MAKLLKASTAKRRAEAVDLLELQFDQVVNGINHAVTYGGTRTSAYLPNEFIAAIADRLTAAGYHVEESQVVYSDPFDWGAPPKKSFLRKIVDMVSPSPSTVPVLEPSMDGPRFLSIAWGDEEEALAA